MATDPVERMRSEQRRTPFSGNLKQRLIDLAHLPPSVDNHYVSVYIDWRPEGENPGVRPGKTILENQIAERRREFKESGIDTRGFEADVERITGFIDDGIDPAVHGIFILASDANNIFETVFIAMPFETSLLVSPTPSLQQLMAVVEDYPRFVVLHADQHDASMFVINRASPQSEVYLESNEYPRKQSQGGWSQQRFQARQDERLQHFARAVAEEVRRVMDDEKIDMLVLSASEVFNSALDHEFHQTVKERIVGEIHLPTNAGENDIVEHAQKVVEQAERAREAKDIQKLEDALGAGNHGAAGTDDVINALLNGQVMILLMADDYKATGWADYNMNLFGSGDIPSEHPSGGDPKSLVEIDLAQELVRLALSTSAWVEIVQRANAAHLNRHGGVAALLRF
jgi:protein required for attachment to host cells